MIITYKYKLYNNKRYTKKFNEWLSICRYLYNAAKETKDTAYEYGVNLSCYDLQKQLTVAKQEILFLNKVSIYVLQKIIERLDLGYQKFFADLRKGRKTSRPHWAKKKYFKSFGFKADVKQTSKGFILPKFGLIKVHNNRIIEGKIKIAELVQKADGIYIHVTVEVGDKKYCLNENQIGIDLGISHFLVTSDGKFVNNPKFLKNKLKILKVEQRKLSRRERGSNRWNRQANRVARLYKNIADSRRDFLHKQSTYFATNYSHIVVENLNVEGMIKGKLSQYISDAAWQSFVIMLDYKANNLIKINPAYTSQECSKCGYISKENRLTQSKFKCVSCGFEINADKNGAINILGRAFPNSRKRELLSCALAI